MYFIGCLRGQDGTIYKGLSFRGDGNAKVTIKDIEAYSTVATMKWDKADKIKPHDNSMTKRIDFGKDIPINISWTLKSP